MCGQEKNSFVLTRVSFNSALKDTNERSSEWLREQLLRVLLHKDQHARCSDTKMEEGCFHVSKSIGHDASPHFHPASPNRRIFHSRRQRINNRTDATSRWWKVDQPKEHQERTLTATSAERGPGSLSSSCRPSSPHFWVGLGHAGPTGTCHANTP